MTKKRPIFATIIVDFKTIQVTCDYIKRFCTKLIGHEDMPFVIVDNSVIDNEIRDTEFKRIEALPLYKTSYNEIVVATVYRYKSHDVFYIKSDRNGGYAKGNNIGADYLKNVLNVYPKYFLFTNNDIELLEKTSFSEFFDVFESDETIGAIGPKIVEKSGKQTSPRKKLSPFKLLVTYNINLIFGNRLKKYVDDIDYTNEKKKVYWVMGCFLFTDSKKFFEVGMFDTKTFLYSEEMILSERFMKCGGYSMLYLPTVSVLHNHSQTINKHVESNAKVNYLFQSHKICCKYYRNTGKGLLICADIVYAIYNMMFQVKRLIKRCFKGKGERNEN